MTFSKQEVKSDLVTNNYLMQSDIRILPLSMYELCNQVGFTCEGEGVYLSPMQRYFKWVTTLNQMRQEGKSNVI